MTPLGVSSPFVARTHAPGDDLDMVLVAALACARSGWLAPAPLPPDPEGCAPAAIARVPGGLRAPVEVWLEEGADPARAELASQVAAAWWREAGVELELRGVRSTEVGDVLGGDPLALRGASPDAWVGAVVAPLREWLARRPRSGARIDLVVVRRITSPRSAMARVATDLAGFTVAPSLLAELGDAEPDLAATLAERLGPDLVPTVFVSSEVLARLPPEEARWVVAHELGHALGLPHDGLPGNLMSEGFYACRPSLRVDQAGRLAE